MDSDIHFEELSMDVTTEIFAHLDAVTQHRLRRVCSMWNALISRSPTLRRFVMLHWTITESTFFGRGSSWRRVPMAFAACLGGETRVLLLRIEKQQPTDYKVYQWYPASDWRVDWLEALFFDMKYYKGAERLHTIIFQGNGNRAFDNGPGTWLQMHEFPQELPESVTKVVLANINVHAEASDDIPGQVTIDEIFTTATIHKGSAWPWNCDGKYGGLKALAVCLGPLDASKEQAFVQNLAFHHDPKRVLQALKWYETRFGDAKVANGLVQLDFATLRRCQPWIQQVIYLRLKYNAGNVDSRASPDVPRSALKKRLKRRVRSFSAPP